eukprot:1367586-Prymnesium_polylepis.1
MVAATAPGAAELREVAAIVRRLQQGVWRCGGVASINRLLAEPLTYVRGAGHRDRAAEVRLVGIGAAVRHLPQADGRLQRGPLRGRQYASISLATTPAGLRAHTAGAAVSPTSATSVTH